MKICVILIAVITIPILSFSQRSIGQKFRTDGFYYFDNGLDTIVRIPNGEEMHYEMLLTMKKEGYVEADHIYSALDSIPINSEGSTLIQFLAFYNTSSGMIWGSAIRNDNVVDTFIRIYERRKVNFPQNKLDETYHISDLYFKNDSEFSFLEGATNSYFMQSHSCVFVGDKLRVKTERKANLGYNYPVQDFVFIPFANIPKDLTKLPSNAKGKR